MRTTVRSRSPRHDPEEAQEAPGAPGAPRNKRKLSDPVEVDNDEGPLQRMAVEISSHPARQAWGWPSPALLERVLSVMRTVAFGGVSILWAWIFHDKFCGTVLGCGCSWPWDGGWRNCNYHDPNLATCPWCRASPLASYWTQKSSPISMVCCYVLLPSPKARSDGNSDAVAAETRRSRRFVLRLLILVLPFLVFFVVEFWWTYVYGRLLYPEYPCFVFYKEGQCTEYSDYQPDVPIRLEP